MNIHRLSFVVLLIPLFGCRSLDSAAKPVVLPSVSHITSLEITPNFGDSREATVIDDPQQIERFVAFVNSRSAGWKRPWDTFPSGRYTVVAKNGDETVAVFWPSPGHIGGREGGTDADSNRLRPLSPEEWQELQTILGIAGAKPVVGMAQTKHIN